MATPTQNQTKTLLSLLPTLFLLSLPPLALASPSANTPSLPPPRQTTQCPPYVSRAPSIQIPLFARNCHIHCSHAHQQIQLLPQKQRPAQKKRAIQFCSRASQYYTLWLHRRTLTRHKLDCKLRENIIRTLLLSEQYPKATQEFQKLRAQKKCPNMCHITDEFIDTIERQPPPTQSLQNERLNYIRHCPQDKNRRLSHLFVYIEKLIQQKKYKQARQLTRPLLFGKWLPTKKPTPLIQKKIRDLWLLNTTHDPSPQTQHTLRISQFLGLIPTPPPHYTISQWLSHARRFYKAGQIEVAALFFHHFAETSPRHRLAPKALWNAALLYQKIHRHGSASRCFRRIVYAYPAAKLADEALFKLALISAWKKPREALHYFQKLAHSRQYRLSPQRPLALLHAATLLEKLRRFDDAIKELHLYTRIFSTQTTPQHIALQLQIARLHNRAHRKKETLKILRTILKSTAQNPSNAKQRKHISTLLSSLSRPGKTTSIPAQHLVDTPKPPTRPKNHHTIQPCCAISKPQSCLTQGLQYLKQRRFKQARYCLQMACATTKNHHFTDCITPPHTLPPNQTTTLLISACTLHHKHSCIQLAQQLTRQPHKDPNAELLSLWALQEACKQKHPLSCFLFAQQLAQKIPAGPDCHNANQLFKMACRWGHKKSCDTRCQF